MCVFAPVRETFATTKAAAFGKTDLGKILGKVQMVYVGIILISIK